jgi:hypothetical protein
MKTNLSITAAQVDTARTPVIGVEVEVYASLENAVKLGSLRALTATTAEYTPAGGAGIPTGGRDVMIRAAGPIKGLTGSAMTVTLNVILLDGVTEVTDTAVATFHIPAYTPFQGNAFPIGIMSDLVPTTGANAAFKVKSVTSVASVANMQPGNSFEVWCTPDASSFTFIDCTRNKGGKFNLPQVVEIACGRNAAAYTKLGRSESNPLSITFADRGALEQLNRFNGHKASVRFDVISDDTVLSRRILYSGYFVRATTEYPDGNEEAVATAEGPYEMFGIGYARVSA